MACKRVFGEFEESEFYGLDEEEFFIGYEDCSKISVTTLKCDNPLIFQKPYVETQRDIDYDLLFNYLESDLLSSIDMIRNKSLIGKKSEFDLKEGIKLKWFIDYLLLFKEELKLDPTIDNYKILFVKYKLECADKCYRKRNKPKYVKDMLALLNIANLINLNSNVYLYSSSSPYQQNTNNSLDPIYYLAAI